MEKLFTPLRAFTILLFFSRESDTWQFPVEGSKKDLERIKICKRYHSGSAPKTAPAPRPFSLSQKRKNWFQKESAVPKNALLVAKRGNASTCGAPRVQVGVLRDVDAAAH